MSPKKQSPKPKPYSHTDSDEVQARIVFEGLLDTKHVRPHIRDGDKHPGDDGYLDLMDGSGVPLGRIFAQIKKIPSGATKFSCEEGYIAFSKRVFPFILVCVDTNQKKVFWRHITPDLPIKKNKKSVTLNFSQIDMINGESDHLEKWKTIIRDHQERNYPTLKRQPEKTKPSEAALFSGSVSITEEAELAKSKYRKEIQDAKALLDNDKQETAQKIYLGLLKKIRKDKKTPLLVRHKVHNNLASCYMTLGDDANAAKYFKAAFKMAKPKSELAYRNRALASFLEKKSAEGLSYIEAALRINPRSTDNLNIKATLLKALGRHDDALALYFEEEVSQ